MRRLVLILIAAGTLARVALALLVGPSVDEAYAVVMSRRLALSYYDHPPLLFWTPGLAARLAGSESPLVVRLPFIAMFAATTWVVYRLGAFLFGERAGLWSAVALNLTLFFTLNAASWVLPDGPLLLFSALAMLCFAHATLDDAPHAPVWRGWIGFGVFTGLAVLSKYHGLFLLLGAAVFLTTTREARTWLRRPQPYVAVVLAAAVLSPVWIWNAQHQWASFVFQSRRALPGEGERDSLVSMVAGQAAWMLPWMCLPLLAALASALRAGPRDPRRWLLACIGGGPIVFFTLVAAVGRHGLPHWPAPGYFMLVPLLGRAIAHRLEGGDVLTRRWLKASTAGLAVVLLALTTHVRSGWIGGVFPRLLGRGDPTLDLLQWTPVVERLREWGFPREGVEMAGVTWIDAARLGYALGPDVPVTSIGSDPRGFAYVLSQEAMIGRDALLVMARRSGAVEPVVGYAPYFRRIEPLGTIDIVRNGRQEMAVSAYLCSQLLQPIAPGRPR
jgi:4-amino-4-deoxy-L-arabinose transferase-like glycosyltransferase